MVRECRPPAREPARSWLARLSTIATSTPANANSAANISPVGPAPAIKTSASCMVMKPLPSFAVACLRPSASPRKRRARPRFRRSLIRLQIEALQFLNFFSLAPYQCEAVVRAIGCRNANRATRETAAPLAQKSVSWQRSIRPAPTSASTIGARLRLSRGAPAVEKAEIQAKEKEKEMDGPAHAAELRRLNGVCSHERDRDLRQVEVELHPTADEEGAGKELAILAISHGDVECRQSNHNDRG